MKIIVCTLIFFFSILFGAIAGPIEIEPKWIEMDDPAGSVKIEKTTGDSKMLEIEIEPKWVEMD